MKAQSFLVMFFRESKGASALISQLFTSIDGHVWGNFWQKETCLRLLVL